MRRNRLLGSAKLDPQCASDPSPVVPVYQLRPRHIESAPFPAFRALRRQDGPPIARRPTYHVWSWAVAWLAPSRANRTHRPLEWQRMVYWIHFPKEASCLQTVPLPDCMEWRTTAAYSALQFQTVPLPLSRCATTGATRFAGRQRRSVSHEQSLSTQSARFFKFFGLGLMVIGLSGGLYYQL